MRNKVSSITLLTAILSTLVMEVGNAHAATIYVPDDYATIHQAVDAANPGDNIIVRHGTYTENVDLSKDNLISKSVSRI